MTYFISKRYSAGEPYRIVYREVKTHTSKGYPLTYEIKSLPEEYATWEEALAATEQMNANQAAGKFPCGFLPTWL